MRWIVIGAGAVGGTIGGRLAQAGRDVVLVARGDHGAALAERGLVLRAPEGTDVLRPPVVTRPEELSLRADDVLLLTTKTQATAAAVRDWGLAPVAGGGTAGQRLPVVCAQNGLENERLASRWFETVVGACVWLPASHLTPGEVVASGAPLSGVLHLGAHPGGEDPQTPPDDLVTHLAAGLTVERLRGVARGDVARWKRAKLLSNLGNGLDAALSGPRADWDDIGSAARAEARAAMRALGLSVASHAEQEAERGSDVDAVEVPGAPRGGSSTWQSLERGQDTEVEHLNGEVVVMGRLAGVPTPVNSAITRLVTIGSRTGRRPRWLDPAVLRAEAGLPAPA